MRGRAKMRHSFNIWGAFSVMKKYWQFKVGVWSDRCKGREVTQMVLVSPLPFLSSSSFSLLFSFSSSFSSSFPSFSFSSFSYRLLIFFFLSLMNALGNPWEFCFMLNGSQWTLWWFEYKESSTDCFISCSHDLMIWKLISLFYGWGNWGPKSVRGCFWASNPGLSN